MKEVEKDSHSLGGYNRDICGTFINVEDSRRFKLVDPAKSISDEARVKSRHKSINASRRYH